MPARFDDATPFENENLIRVDHCRKTVRDQDRDQILAQGYIANRFADLLLGKRVQRRRRFVEHKEIRSSQEGACDGKSLLFSAGHLDAALADQRIEALVSAR